VPPCKRTQPHSLSHSDCTIINFVFFYTQNCWVVLCWRTWFYPPQVVRWPGPRDWPPFPLPASVVGLELPQILGDAVRHPICLGFRLFGNFYPTMLGFFISGQLIPKLHRWESPNTFGWLSPKYHSASPKMWDISNPKVMGDDQSCHLGINYPIMKKPNIVGWSCP